MTLSVTQVLTYAVTFLAWMAPMPQYSTGLIVNYGSERVLRANAEFRGYDYRPYACLGSLMSPSQLGEVFWLRTATHPDWMGPCLNVDAAQRKHFLNNVYRSHEIAEVSDKLSAILGFEYGGHGEIWIGGCPPKLLRGQPSYYEQLPLSELIDWRDPDALEGYTHRIYPYPKQRYPSMCSRRSTPVNFGVIVTSIVSKFKAVQQCRPTRFNVLESYVLWQKKMK